MRKLNIDEILAKYQNLMKEINNKLSNNDWTKESFESPDGSYRYTSFVKVVDLSDFYNQDVDDKKMSKEEYLTYKLQQAVENEDFEEAIKLRDQISNLKTNQEEIEKLELDLKEAIKSQDFEKAIKLRDELKKLK
jgi:excinuclease UvrABC helicase subunit UvrB